MGGLQAALAPFLCHYGATIDRFHCQYYVYLYIGTLGFLFLLSIAAQCHLCSNCNRTFWLYVYILKHAHSLLSQLVPDTTRPEGDKNKSHSGKAAAMKLAGTAAIIVFISYCGYKLWPQ